MAPALTSLADIMRAALAQAGAGRRHILEQMAKCNPPPRSEVSSFAPCLLVWQVSAAGLCRALCGGLCGT